MPLSEPVHCSIAGGEALGGMVALARACYGERAESEAWWRWRFFADGADSFVALASQGGRSVGMQPVRLERCLAGARTWHAAIFEGAMVAPESRGGGLFSRLVSLALEESWARGAAFALTMPNGSSHPILLRHGWHDLGERIAFWAPPFANGPFSSRRRANDVAAGETSRRAESAGADVGSAAGGGVIRPVHDAAWRRWRYANPEAAYAIVGDAAAGGGFAAGRIHKVGPLPIGIVMESEGESAPEGSAIGSEAAALRALREQLRRRGALLMLAVVASPAQQQTLSANGFRRLPAGLLPRRFRTVYQARPGLAAGELPHALDGWRLSLSDWDGL